jgi:hypothetical protein
MSDFLNTITVRFYGLRGHTVCCQDGVIDGFMILYHSHRVNNGMLRANDISCYEIHVDES